MRSEQLASMLSSFIWVVAVVLICAGAYYFLTHLPSRSEGSEVAVTRPATPPAPKTPSVPAARPAPETKSPVPAEASPVAATPSGPAAPSAASLPAANSAIQLTVLATEPVWVSATADGKTAFAELLTPGVSKIVAATSSARLMLGNAGGAEITFNGKKLEPFGAKGDVRTVDFTPQSFQVISRTSPSAGPSANPDPLR